MLSIELPTQFAFLQRRRKELESELEEIKRLEDNIIETRTLLDRTMSTVGAGLSRKEYEECESGVYARLFLDEKLEYAAEEFIVKGRHPRETVKDDL